MSLQSTAQDQLLVVDPAAFSPLEVSMPVEDGTDLSNFQAHDDMAKDSPMLEVQEPGDVDIMVEELPGAPAGTKDPEPMLEVMDTPLQVDEKPTADDANDAKKAKNEKWDWASKGPTGFVAWIKEKVDSVPKHSGYDSAGLERAMAYMERVDAEISKAMRMDLDGELDANKIEKVRSELDEGIARLQVRLEKVKDSKKSSKKRKKSTSEESALGLVKEAQKILGVSGVYIMAPLLISGIARICINGTVSAGHDIGDLYQRQVKKWKLSDREQFELKQLLFDMGFPMPYDRSIDSNEDFDPASEDNLELMPNYKG